VSNERRLTVTVRGSLVVNDGSLAVQAAIEGIGVTRLTEMSAAAALATGTAAGRLGTVATPASSSIIQAAVRCLPHCGPLSTSCSGIEASFNFPQTCRQNEAGTPADRCILAEICASHALATGRSAGVRLSANS